MRFDDSYCFSIDDSYYFSNPNDIHIISIDGNDSLCMWSVGEKRMNVTYMDQQLMIFFKLDSFHH